MSVAFCAQVILQLLHSSRRLTVSLKVYRITGDGALCVGVIPKGANGDCAISCCATRHSRLIQGDRPAKMRVKCHLDT